MDFGISTRCFGNTPLTRSLLERLPASEFPRLELHAVLPGFNYRNRSFLREIARSFRESEIDMPGLHLPFEEDLLAPQHFERERALDDLKRCLELADLLPISYAVLHLGSPQQHYSPVFFEYAYSATNLIRNFSGLRIMIETLDNEVATFARIAEFKAVAQIPDIGICYDTGHGEMDGLSNVIHVNDNDGNNDDHRWPFDGNRNWPAFVESLVKSSFNGPLILEASDDRFERGVSAKSRLQDLWYEATNSIEEFRLKYKLPQHKPEDEE
jgi:sugar phosphate isomerase/epimerase